MIKNKMTIPDSMALEVELTAEDLRRIVATGRVKSALHLIDEMEARLQTLRAELLENNND